LSRDPSSPCGVAGPRRRRVARAAATALREDGMAVGEWRGAAAASERRRADPRCDALGAGRHNPPSPPSCGDPPTHGSSGGAIHGTYYLIDAPGSTAVSRERISVLVLHT